MNHLFPFLYIVTCLAKPESVDPEIIEKAREAIKQRQRSFEHNGVIHGLFTQGERWHYSTLDPREALVGSGSDNRGTTDSIRDISDSVQDNRDRVGAIVDSSISTSATSTESRDRPSGKGSSTELSTPMRASSTPKMKGWLDTLALLTMLFSVGNGFFWPYEVPEGDRFDAGVGLTEGACKGVDSDECREVRDKFWSPREATTAIPAEGASAAPPTPIPEDPCHQGKCFNWGDYRKQVIDPFVNQLQQAQAIGRFGDDEEEGSLFSFSNFKDWYETQISPPDGQTISAQTAAVLSLKFLAASLAQTRIARVEASHRDGITWQAAISIPGCFLLAIYLLISLHQLKRLWKVRCDRNEDSKNTKLINRLFTPSAPRDPEAVGLELRQVDRTRVGR